MRLADKAAVLTGAANGIGAATARRFAEEGASVVVADVDEALGSALASEIVEAGGKAVFSYCDVAERADLAAFFKHGLIEVFLDGNGAKREVGRRDGLGHGNRCWFNIKAL